MEPLNFLLMIFQIKMITERRDRRNGVKGRQEKRKKERVRSITVQAAYYTEPYRLQKDTERGGTTKKERDVVTQSRLSRRYQSRRGAKGTEDRTEGTRVYQKNLFIRKFIMV